MSRITWDAVGERSFETGVDHGVLYIPNNLGVYNDGVPWNGLTGITEKPSGAEATPIYADNMQYLNLVSVEKFNATLEALTYPPEFAPFDGVGELAPGVLVGQQARRSFGLCYRSLAGNDLDPRAGYKLHLAYGLLAAPSEKAYATVNETPEAMPFSWELTSTPVEIPGLDANNKPFAPSAIITIDSRDVDADDLAALEVILFGKDATTSPVAPAVNPRLPLPAELIEIFGA